jgi:hypothetical protein
VGPLEGVTRVPRDYPTTFYDLHCGIRVALPPEPDSMSDEKRPINCQTEMKFGAWRRVRTSGAPTLPSRGRVIAKQWGGVTKLLNCATPTRDFVATSP